MIEEFTVRRVHRIGVISDTHIPTRAAHLPEKVFDLFQDVDLIVHAGDAVSLNIIQELRGIAEVIAVYGNMCDQRMREEFPYKCIINVNGFKIGVIHGHGSDREQIEQHVLQEFQREPIAVDCIIYGHVHHPMNEIIDNVLFFNPGSACDNKILKYNTIGILTVEDKKHGGKIMGEILSLSNEADNKEDNEGDNKTDNKTDNKINNKTDNKINNKINNKTDNKINNKTDNKMNNKINNKTDNKMNNKINNKTDNKMNNKINNKTDNKMNNKINNKINNKGGDA